MTAKDEASTDAGVHVHVGRHRTIPPKAAPIAISIVMMIFGAVTFASTYLFATKTELTEQAVKPVARLNTDIQIQSTKLDALTEQQRDMRTDIRLANRNLSKLLRQRGIEPALRSDVEAEGGEE